MVLKHYRCFRPVTVLEYFLKPGNFSFCSLKIFCEDVQRGSLSNVTNATIHLLSQYCLSLDVPDVPVKKQSVITESH